ncbi:serine/arginine repetitive matrix protein 1-like [Penaeus indicus]|uniref:serine/arginine repetitive matrix protein 1-like n=1 Tax=Penaeus indicus TaxID=29960 RepID=UPI00300C79B5
MRQYVRRVKIDECPDDGQPAGTRLPPRRRAAPVYYDPPPPPDRRRRASQPGLKIHARPRVDVRAPRADGERRDREAKGKDAAALPPRDKAERAVAGLIKIRRTRPGGRWAAVVRCGPCAGGPQGTETENRHANCTTRPATSPDTRTATRPQASATRRAATRHDTLCEARTKSLTRSGRRFVVVRVDAEKRSWITTDMRKDLGINTAGRNTAVQVSTMMNRSRHSQVTALRCRREEGGTKRERSAQPRKRPAGAGKSLLTPPEPLMRRTCSKGVRRSLPEPTRRAPTDISPVFMFPPTLTRGPAPRAKIPRPEEELSQKQPANSCASLGPAPPTRREDETGQQPQPCPQDGRVHATRRRMRAEAARAVISVCAGGEGEEGDAPVPGQRGGPRSTRSGAVRAPVGRGGDPRRLARCFPASVSQETTRGPAGPHAGLRRRTGSRAVVERTSTDAERDAS